MILEFTPDLLIIYKMYAKNKYNLIFDVRVKHGIKFEDALIQSFYG